jgi:hypothetical protein
VSREVIYRAMDPIGANAFIVMSGPPQKGKRERLSKARSHITKAYFEKQKGKAKLPGHISQCPRTSPTRPFFALEQANTQRLLEPTIPPQVPFTLLSADHPMRNSSVLMSETSRRLQRCECDLASRTFLKRENPFPSLRDMRWIIPCCQTTYERTDRSKVHLANNISHTI